MPSGPEAFVQYPAYETEFTRARELVLGHPGRWRIIYHYDGDGIAGGSALAIALRRLGYPVHASPLVGVERERMAELLTATNGPAIVVDTGASWLDLAATHPHPVVVLDHHRYEGVPTPPKLPDHVGFVNPLDWGVDGMTELCGASLAWLFTIFLDPRNWDNAPWGISGAIADRQHVGGFKGLNKALVDGAVQRSFVVRRRGINLMGPNVGEALARSIDPFFRGLSGHPETARSFLKGLRIDPMKPPVRLEPEEEKALTLSLLQRLVQQGTRPEFCDVLTQEGWQLPSVGLTGSELSNLQNACGRIGSPGLGIALALGDPQALDRARSAEESWRSGILDGLRRLEDGGVNSLEHVQWFESPETTLAGTQAGLAMNYLLDSRRPVFVFSKGHDGRSLKVSGRGTIWLVEHGLDLATACRESASRVHGEGGGHPVASGATITPESRDAFLSAADAIVGAQLRFPSNGGSK